MVMVTGLDDTRVKKKPWKSQMERDIMLHTDLKEVITQGGKAFGEILKQKKKKK
jgi:hypothetical protein